MKNFQVFISYKNTDERGFHLKDREMAASLYDSLTQHGISVFFSDESLTSLGTTHYKEAIDEALDAAEILIVVGTSLKNITSSWVKYEWDSFYGDILSRKKAGQMFSYIDDISASDLPRTLRQLQVFEANKWDMPKICQYISNALGCNNNSTLYSSHLNAKSHSVYSPIEQNEPTRLINQANLVLDNDLFLITPIINLLSSTRKINILDVGCASGYLTKQIFDNFTDKINRVIGIDRERTCIETANLMCPEFYSFYYADIESPDFEDSLSHIMKINGIDGFDLVYSSLVLHHLSDPKKFLVKLRKYIKKGGNLYLRSCDDDEIIAYPDPDNIVENTIKSTYTIPGISDRLHGRKLYHELYKTGYTKIAIKPYYITTSDMTIDARIQLCHDMLYWRRHRYKRLIDRNPENMEYLKQYNDFCTNYEQIEEMFFDPAFFFKVSGPIAIAEK